MNNNFSYKCLLFLSSIFFVVALNFSHEIYLNPEQEIWGFPYYSLSLINWVFLICMIAPISMMLPMSFERPSGLVLFILYLFVYLPTLVITLAVSDEPISLYWLSLGVLAVGFFVICLSVRFSRNKININFLGVSKFVDRFFILTWSVLFFILIFQYHEVMNFVGLNDIYAQRELGRSSGFLMGYVQTYFAYILSPGILAIGFNRNKYSYVFLAGVGFLTMFMIAAERSVFLMPFAIFALHFLLKKRVSHKNIIVGGIVFIALVILFSSLFHGENVFFELVALYLTFRLFAVPGAMFSQYQTVFNEIGYTFWSNVSGIRLLSKAPDGFIDIENWPQLGYVVADRILGVYSNSNANPFAYDGIAGGGVVGVFLICILISIWLFFLDKSVNEISPDFFLLVIFPVGFLMTNGSFFSVMTSFGGFFWIVFFVFIRRKNFSVYNKIFKNK
ncbi:hypothetical protein [Acidovorax carolinensis]|uniref:hypothetical protein n=1 Tax=Acidovorax carolinensis TaxID=553814 RepID=UPI0012FFBCAC|nr:hypothetical protein [Acidovorax carolinensis]